MKTTFYSLVVIPPFGSRGPKLQISRPALLILAAAYFALCFFATVAWLLFFPRIQSSDAARYRLAAENQTLKIDNTNAEFRVRRLNTQLSHVEEVSNRITALIDADSVVAHLEREVGSYNPEKSVFRVSTRPR